MADTTRRRDAAPQPARPPSAPRYPFQGLRVLDFGIGAVGVEIGRLFAEYGADVIKVESRVHPDFMRVIEGGTISPPFVSSSRSKRFLGVNTKTERGRQVVHALARDTDILIENSGVGVIARMGVDYETLRGLNPRIIMVSSQLMGSSGPWSSWTGYGPSAHTVSGLTHLWNYPDEESPVGSQNVYPDHLVPRIAAAAAVAALIQRDRTGVGCHVDVAQFEAPLGFLGDLFLQESLLPGSVTPQGNDSPRGAPWGPYLCAGEDAWCVINVRNDHEWDRLRDAMGDPDWARNPEYAAACGRIRRRAEIDRCLSEWTASRTPREVMTLLQDRGIPAGMIQNPADQATDPHLTERGYLRPVDQPPFGRLILEGPAFHGTKLPEPIVGPAGELGAHTREICRDVLGMPEAEIEELLAAGVLEEPTPSAGD